MFKRRQKTSGRSPSKPSGGSPVFSYYNNRPSDTASTKQRKRSLAVATRSRASILHHLHRLPTYIAVLLIGGSIIYATTLDTQPKVLLGKSPDSNTLLRSSATYQSAIAKILDNSIFSQNKLSINTESIAKQIQTAFPEIQEATVSIPLVGRRPIIGLNPAEPAIIFSNSSGSYIMASDGRILIRTADLASNNKVPKLPAVQDDSNIAVEQGKQALPKEDVTFITTVLFQLSSKSITPEVIKLPAVPNELHVKIAGAGYYIKFNIVGDARVQVGAYLAVKNRLQSQNTSPSEYIDVRVEDRVYYK